MSAPPATCAKGRTPLGVLFNAGELRPCPGRAVGAAAEPMLTAVGGRAFPPSWPGCRWVRPAIRGDGEPKSGSWIL